MSNKTRWVVVDDDDQGWSFTGDWTVRHDTFSNYEAFGQTYRGSQHGSNTTGNISYSFTGSEVQLYGTSAVQLGSNGFTPSWGCQIDDEPISVAESSSGPANNWPLCGWNGFSRRDGPHTFTVNATAGDGSIFWVDWLRYRPSFDLELDRSTVMIEYTDPSITYTSGHWQKITDDEAGDAILAMQPTSALAIAFKGTKISWYGWTPRDYPTGSSTGTYSIDGQRPIKFNMNGPTSTYSLHYQKHFETESLEYGDHALVVTHEGPSTPLVLDFFLVEDGAFRIPTDPIRILPSNADSFSPPSPTANGTARTDGSESEGPPVRIIVGGVIGGLGLVALLVVIFIILKRQTDKKEGNVPPTGRTPRTRRTRKASRQLPSNRPSAPTTNAEAPLRNRGRDLSAINPTVDEAMVQAQIIRPFLVAQTSFSNLNTFDTPNVKSTRLSPLRRGMTLSSPITSSDTGSSVSASHGTQGQQPTYMSTMVTSDDVHVVQHEDSGLRIPIRRVVNLPPSYTPN